MLQDRAGFLAWVAKTFSYDEKNADAGLFVQQRFVRDFLQSESPYRGLLLFHGLGVGKSCASIAAAEVIRYGNRHKEVVVLAPASLKRSYMEEIKKCGSPDFSASGDVEDVKRLIRTAYRFVSYNGITAKSVGEFVSGPENYFENKVVVIDEAHNFVSRVVNNGLVTSVYQRIMDAANCKVILLSGTPLINSPHELAYLVNLAMGYQRILEVTLATPLAYEEALMARLSQVPGVDRTETSRDSHTVRIKLLPPGFVHTTKTMHMARLESSEQAETQTRTETQTQTLVKACKNLVQEYLAETSPTNKVVRTNLAKRLVLPVDKLAFSELFLKPVDQADGTVAYTVKNASIMERRVAGCVSFFSAYDAALYPRVSSTHVVTLPMSARQFSEYSLKRDEERKKEETARRFATRRASRGSFDDDDAGATQTYRAYSRSICNFVFPEALPRPYRADMRKMLEEQDSDPNNMKSQSSNKISSNKNSNKDLNLSQDKMYNDKLDRALQMVEQQTTALHLQRADLTDVCLEQHSPKFARIIRHLQAKGNTAIVYSSFKKVEGIGLLAAAMRANGWAQISVKYDEHKDIVFSATLGNADRASANQSRRRRAFMIYENEEEELSQTMLNLFNSALTRDSKDLKKKTLESLRDAIQALDLDSPKTTSNNNSDIDDMDNTHGQIVQALLLTPSGAEGLNLRNVREVHLMEPFWHLNRIDQVIGRAVRARSHLSLPPEERQVDIYMYLTALTPDQIRDNTSIRLQDKGISSDHFVHEIAKRKRRLIETVLEIMRRAAVDCRLHAPKHGNRQCARTADGAAGGRPAYPMDITEDDDHDRDHQHNTSKDPQQLVRVAIRGKTQLLDRASGTIYDMEAYERDGTLTKIAQIRLSPPARETRKETRRETLTETKKQKQKGQ